MKKLESKITIVTGASRGLGEAIAKLLANHGATVIINYSSNEQQAKELQ